MKVYAKFLVATAGFAAVFAQVAADGNIDTAEGGLLLTAGLTAIGVLRAKNKPATPGA